MDELLARLPGVYAQFLVLQRAGKVDTVIADRLGVPIESLPLIARLAAAKLARLQAEEAERNAAADVEPSLRSPDRADRHA